jgi:hypothetical protein
VNETIKTQITAALRCADLAVIWLHKPPETGDAETDRDIFAAQVAAAKLATDLALIVRRMDSTNAANQARSDSK